MSTNGGEEDSDLRRGPWTFEEDSKLAQYISTHGEGRWNLLAKCAGLKRTGKSCRLRWLNYLKPDIKRGNLTPQEQLLILELHSKWGNRWSKIAAHLPGRTDNEIKNYWRTRVQKQARQLKIDSSSNKFFEALQRFWMPRLLEKIKQNESRLPSFSSTSTMKVPSSGSPAQNISSPMALSSASPNSEEKWFDQLSNEKSSSGTSGQPEDLDYKNLLINDCYHVDISSFDFENINQLDMSAKGLDEISVSDCQMAEIDWMNSDAEGIIWNMDGLWEL